MNEKRTVVYTTASGEKFQFDIETPDLDIDQLELWIKTGIGHNNNGFVWDLTKTLNTLKEERLIILANGSDGQIHFRAEFAGKQNMGWISESRVNDKALLSTVIRELLFIVPPIDKMDVSLNKPLSDIPSDVVGLYIELYEQMIRQENRILSEIKGDLNKIKLERNALLNKEAEQLKVIENLERKRSALLERIGK